MRNSTAAAVVVAVALGACALETELLNSDRIAERFGSYGIELLEQDEKVRRSNLYSIENGERVCRTYAVVQFIEPRPAEVTDAHDRVLAGESLGATFRASGWTIAKETQHIGSLQLDDIGHPIAELMRLTGQATLGIHAYRLVLRKGPQFVPYATIIETHHPDYLDERDLHRLYGRDSSRAADAATLAALTELVLQTN